jgi:hypothetical protein
MVRLLAVIGLISSKLKSLDHFAADKLPKLIAFRSEPERNYAPRERRQPPFLSVG